MSYAIRIEYLGRMGAIMATPFDGKWLAAYDPDRPGVDPEGRPMLALVEATDDPSQAMAFETTQEAWGCWGRTSTALPERPDGRPNRPLTAFTISIQKL